MIIGVKNMLKKLYVLPICLVLFLILPLVTSCTSAGNSGVALVPQTANTVVEVQVGQILSDMVLQGVYTGLAQQNPSWPQTEDAAVNQILLKTGLDLSGVSTAVCFADIESNDQTQNTYKGIIASGNFNETTSIAKIKQQTPQTLTTSVYKGFTIYTETQDQSVIVFLSKRQFVFGSLKAVQDVIDVSKGSQQALSGSVVSTLNRLNPALIVGASVAVKSFLRQIGKDSADQNPLSFQSLQGADNIGFAFNQPNLSLSFRVDAHFSDTDSLQSAKDSISSLISSQKATGQDSIDKTLLNNVQVSAANSWLSIQDLLNPADIAALFTSTTTQK
jgi:hypothetical protein